MPNVITIVVEAVEVIILMEIYIGTTPPIGLVRMVTSTVTPRAVADEGAMRRHAETLVEADTGLEIYTGTTPPIGHVRMVMSTVTSREAVDEGAMKRHAETLAMEAADMGRALCTGITLLTDPVLPDMSIVTGGGAAVSGVMHQDAVDRKCTFYDSEFTFGTSRVN